MDGHDSVLRRMCRRNRQWGESRRRRKMLPERGLRREEGDRLVQEDAVEGVDLDGTARSAEVIRKKGSLRRGLQALVGGRLGGD